MFDVIDDNKFIIFLALTKYFFDVVVSGRVIIMRKLKKLKIL